MAYWYAVTYSGFDSLDNGSEDRSKAERIAWARIDDGHTDVKIAKIDPKDSFCLEEYSPADFMTPHVIGKWTDSSNIDVVEIDGSLYALDGWNGEKYGHCWKCKDRFTADPDDDGEYEIAPVYNWAIWNEEDGEFQDENGAVVDGICGYEVL